MVETVEVNTLTLSILEDAPLYQRWIVERIEPWLGERILEVGCGTGNLTGLLLPYGEVIATDVNPSYLQTVAERFGSHFHLKGVYCWDIRLPPPPELPENFTTIVCSNVLEHVEEDGEALAGFYRLLSGRGKLILLVPALPWLYNGLDRELGHMRRYDKLRLEGLLHAQGFRVCHIGFFNLFGVVGWFMNGTILRRRLLPIRQVRIFNRLVPLLRRIESLLPPVLGQSLIAVAEKVEKGGSS